MDVRIVVYNQAEHKVESALITDDNGWEWLYVSSGLGLGDNYNAWRTLDIVYPDDEVRDKDSGYYACSLDHALHILSDGGW